MAIRKINSRSLVDDAIATADIADGSISTAKLADDAVTTPKVASSVNLGRRNIIINGAMQVAQRGTSATSVSTEGYKTVDRFKWTMDTTSSVYTLSQSTDVPSGQGFANSFKTETTTADATLDANCQIRFEQRFEGQDVQQLAKGTSNAKSVTLSFWVKAFQTGTYILNLQDTDNSRLIAATYTVNSSATWEYKTVTFAGDTTGAFTNDSDISLVVHWYLSAGSNYTSGTLATSWESLTTANRAVGQTVDIASNTSNYWAITGAQLEVGDTATPFEHRSYGEELQLCKRYYEKIGNWGNTNGYYQMCVYRSRALSMGFQIQYTVEKRVDNPSVTWYSPDETTTGEIYRISDGGGSSIAIQYGPSGNRHGVYRTQHTSNPASPVDSGYSAKLTVECEL